ncbi:unnamed protein product [Callosobruchus maculatus]|uniref:TonB-dependent receptor plug domain-containing protein n=1 Tax=Callosobruchus maculatus TaxID=64391 RepID=A0A653BNY2_CALMS|nr:unnamed protein product [Callosobruchus maculatus]
MIKKVSLLTALSVTAFSGWAQESADSLVVTANRFEQPVKTVLAPTSVVTREDIERWQSTTVLDVMRRLPGVDTAQNGGMGQMSSLFIRGTNSSHVLILVDGMRLTRQVSQVHQISASSPSPLCSVSNMFVAAFGDLRLRRDWRRREHYYYPCEGRSFTPDVLVDTRQLYSQTWDAGLRFNDDIFHSQLLTSYSHSKDYNYDPHSGRYDSSATLDEIKQYNVQWVNSVDVGHGNVGAGVDWQKQSTEPGTNYVTMAMICQFGDVTLEGAVRSDDNSQFGRHGTWQSSAAWEFIEGYRVIASYGTAYKAPNLGQLYGFYGNEHLDPEESKQWEGAFEGLTAGVNWRVSAYRNDVDNLIDFNNNLQEYYNVGKARIKGVEATASFDTGPVMHTVGYDYVDARIRQPTNSWIAALSSR